jgi:hypothetical protein
MTPEQRADLREMMDKAKREAPVKGWLPYAALTAALAELDDQADELRLLRVVASDDQPDDARIHAQMVWRAKYGDRP